MLQAARPRMMIGIKNRCMILALCPLAGDINLVIADFNSRRARNAP